MSFGRSCKIGIGGVFLDNGITDKKKDKATAEVMDDDSKIVEKTRDEQVSILEDERFEGDKQNDKNKKNKLESNVVNAADLSKNRWAEILDEVQPVAPILLKKFPSMTLRYKLIINELKAAIRDLPLSQDLLPTYIKLCKSTIRFLQEEKKRKLWKNYTNKVELEQLENSLKLLFSKMISIAIELKVDSDISSSEAIYVTNQNKKQADRNTSISVDEKQDEDKKNKLKTNYNKVDKSKNWWTEMLEEVQPIAPILISRFPIMSDKYSFTIEHSIHIIQTLPRSRDLLPMYISSCKQLFRLLQKEKKNGLWNDFAIISVELEQLENSLKLLFSKMVSIAIELKVGLV